MKGSFDDLRRKREKREAEELDHERRLRELREKAQSKHSQAASTFGSMVESVLKELIEAQYPGGYLASPPPDCALEDYGDPSPVWSIWSDLWDGGSWQEVEVHLILDSRGNPSHFVCVKCATRNPRTAKAGLSRSELVGALRRLHGE